MANIRWAYRFLHKKKILLFIGLILIVVNTVLELLQVAAQKVVLDGISNAGEMRLVVLGILVLAICYFGTSILFFVMGTMFHTVFFNWREQATRRLYQCLQNLSIHYFKEERISQMTVWFSEVEQIGNDLFSLPYKCGDFIKFLLMAFIIMKIDRNVFFLLMVINLITVYLMKHIGTSVKSFSKRRITGTHNILICIEEGVAGAREIATYQYENTFFEKYSKLFSSFFSVAKHVVDLKNRILLISTLLKWFGILAAIVLTWSSVKSGKISIGTFFILYQYVNQFLDLYQKINDHWFDIQKMNAHINKIREKWEDFEANHFSDGTIEIDHITNLEFRDVCFSYHGTEQILDKVSFDIHIGEKNGIIGASGSGKSTIIELLMKNYDTEQGGCYVNGNINLNNITLKSWLDKIRIVYQDCYIFKDTIRNNILLGKKGIADEEILRVCKLVKLDELIYRLPGGLNDEIGERGMNISGGQRQRLAMARALVCNAEILILDEATSALDEQTEVAVQASIDACYMEKTMIIVAHRLSTIKNTGNIIKLMSHGGDLINE